MKEVRSLDGARLTYEYEAARVEYDFRLRCTVWRDDPELDAQWVHAGATLCPLLQRR